MNASVFRVGAGPSANLYRRHPSLKRGWCLNLYLSCMGMRRAVIGRRMPYVVNDADFSKMMVDVQVSNALNEKLLKHMEMLDYWFYFLVCAEIVLGILLVLEWRFPHLVKKYLYPPEAKPDDKTAPLVLNAV